MDEKIAKMSVEKAYSSGLAKQISIPSLAGASPMANGKTALGINYQQPSNNGAYVTLDDLYPSLSEAEKQMTVADYLASKKPSNRLLWGLALLGVIFIAVAAWMLWWTMR